MKKLFNDNAKMIAVAALVGCAVLGYMLYKQNRKPQTLPDGKVKTEKLPDETEQTEKSE